MSQTAEISEVLLGFDARRRLDAAAAAWGEERRQRFLLRPELLRPLSVDRAVWPSTAWANTVRPDAVQPDAVQPDAVTARGWTGPLGDGLWADLDGLDAALDRDRSSVRLAVTAHLQDPENRRALAERLRGVLPSGERAVESLLGHPWTSPAERDPAWELLGYDVADFAGETSALMNLGFVQGLDDVEALRRRWGPFLGQHHLFDHIADADAFRPIADARAPEHAPFFVHGLWRLDPE